MILKIIFLYAERLNTIPNSGSLTQLFSFLLGESLPLIPSWHSIQKAIFEWGQGFPDSQIKLIYSFIREKGNKALVIYIPQPTNKPIVSEKTCCNHVTSIDLKYINVQEHYLTVISLTEDKACAFYSGNKNTRSKTIYNYL